MEMKIVVNRLLFVVSDNFHFALSTESFDARIATWVEPSISSRLI